MRLNIVLPLLAMAFVSSIGFVSAQTSDTTRTLHVDMANGHSFDIPYSISGATVTDVKADTSIPKMTISISANADGQITLQVPGGDNNSANQNDFAVLVDGQNSQYTQFFDNGHRMVTILFHSTSSTIDLVGQHTKRDIQNVQYNQTSTSCSQDEIQNAKQGIDNLREKMNTLRTQYYNDWQIAYNSGQYNGTWEQYSRDKLMSSDSTQLKLDYEKFNSILKSCGPSPMREPFHPSTTCSQGDIAHARQELATTEKRGGELKNKIYQQFQQDQDSGQFNGTWTQYAQAKFWNLPEVLQIKSSHDKFADFMKSCFGQPKLSQGFTQNPDEASMPAPAPSTSNADLNPISSDNLDLGTIHNDPGLGENSMTMPDAQSQNLMPTISGATDAQGIISSSQGLPSWVKGIAGWWASGKISDDDFVNAIKFLVHQGIIKV